MTNLLQFPLALAHHSACVLVRPDAGGGWDVSTELDGHEIASDYCSDWHRVERFRARMQRWLQTAEAAVAERTAGVM